LGYNALIAFMVCPPMLHRQTGATKCCLSQKLSVRYLVDVTSSQKKEPLHPSLCLSSPKRRTLPNGKEKKRKKNAGISQNPWISLENAPCQQSLF